MKNLIFSLFCLLSFYINGQDTTEAAFDPHTWKAPYYLSEPKDWGIERFLIPIGFAPQIPYKGMEDIRFAPGWSKKASEEYWSYAFLWYLDGDIKMDAKLLDSNMRLYYRGLIAAAGSKIPKEKLIPVVTSFKEVKKSKGDAKTFEGTIKMTDYMKHDPITLNCKVHLRSCGKNKTILFYELSQQPFSHSIWIGLDKLWADFKCKNQ